MAWHCAWLAAFLVGLYLPELSAHWDFLALALSLSGLLFTGCDIVFSYGRQLDDRAALVKQAALAERQAKTIVELEDEANALRDKLCRAQLDNAVLQAGAADG